MKKGYVEHPCGEIPLRWERQEKYELQRQGYDINPAKLVETFEEKIANYAGSRYTVATNGCTSALFLSLMYLKYIEELYDDEAVFIPKRTYFSVPMTIINCGLTIKFEDIKWKGAYFLEGTRVIDSATRFTKDMYTPESLSCISFQYRKRLPIGRGGAILTDDKKAYDWLRKARIDGRHYGVHQWEDMVTTQGWNCYMTHDDAARGIIIFNDLTKDKKEFEDYGSWETYPDLTKNPFFKEHEVND